MTRMLFAAGALALAVGSVSAAALADPAHGQLMPPPAVSAAAASAQPVRWHYEWQYHYGKWGQYAPGWVAVLNNNR